MDVMKMKLFLLTLKDKAKVGSMLYDLKVSSHGMGCKQFSSRNSFLHIALVCWSEKYPVSSKEGEKILYVGSDLRNKYQPVDIMVLIIG